MFCIADRCRARRGGRRGAVRRDERAEVRFGIGRIAHLHLLHFGGESGDVGERSRIDSSGLIKSSGRICRRCSFCRGTGLLTGTVTA